MKIHIVKQGDTLYELSKKYNVPLQKLIESNPQISNPDQLSIGDKVKIPSASVSVGGNEGDSYKHVVKQGDTLWKLSKAWGISLDALVAANPQLSDPNVLKVGDVINIPGKKGTGTGNSGQSGGGTQTNSSAKKNTSPKAEQLKPKTEPVKEPVKEPTNVAPIKQEVPQLPPVQVEIAVEQITYEKPVKQEPTKQSPIAVEEIPNIKVPECPCPEFPNQSYYGTKQQEMVMPAPLNPKSSCGCSGNSQSEPHEHLFYQYQIAAENVSSYYDFPQIPQEQQWTAAQMQGAEMLSGEYPGLSNAPYSKSYEVMGAETAGCCNQGNWYPQWGQPWGQEMPGMQNMNVEWLPIMPSQSMPSSCCGSYNPYAQSMYPNQAGAYMAYPDNIAPAQYEAQSNMQPNMQPNMYPNAQPNIQPFMQSNIPPNIQPAAMESNVPPNVQPIMPLNVQPNMQPIMPLNVQSNMQPNMSPYMYPNMPAMVPNSSLGGFGGGDVLFDRDIPSVEGSGELAIQGTAAQDHAEGTQKARTKSKTKKEVKISGTQSNKNNSKRTSAASGASSKKRAATTPAKRRNTGRSDLWIND